jgi:glycosyltransferase involved in cell wall biosynthesis
MPSAPLVSVIISTWNRGRHLIPTLQSVLWQNYSNIETLVVGDGCDDDTEQIVSSFINRGVRWLNLSKRTRSQSAPNNLGIAEAKGEIIAYLGHDDIWSPDHVNSLVALLSNGTCDFAVAGCLYHGTVGSHFNAVTGLFETDEAKFEHFFPPSSFAHGKSALEIIGCWRAPDEVKPAVDAEFQLRAARGGLKFCSTGRVTVHKFASVHRYLSYLAQDSEEQKAIISKIAEPEFDGWLNAVVGDAKRQGLFMTSRHGDYDRYEKGEISNLNRVNRGLQLPPLRELRNDTWITQTNEGRGLDWYRMHVRTAVARLLDLPLLKSKTAFRWSGPSPTPRILVPFTARNRARIDISVRAALWKLDKLTVASADEQIPWEFKRSFAPWSIISFETFLRPDDYTVLKLSVPTSLNKHGLRVGIAVGQIRLRPLSRRPSTSSG